MNALCSPTYNGCQDRMHSVVHLLWPEQRLVRRKWHTIGKATKKSKYSKSICVYQVSILMSTMVRASLWLNFYYWSSKTIQNYSFKIHLELYFNFELFFFTFFIICTIFFKEPCVDFLKRQAASLDLVCNVYRLFNEKSPIVVISWMGRNPSLPSIMLNSHMYEIFKFSIYLSHDDKNFDFN